LLDPWHVSIVSDFEMDFKTETDSIESRSDSIIMIIESIPTLEVRTRRNTMKICCPVTGYDARAI